MTRTEIMMLNFEETRRRSILWTGLIDHQRFCKTNDFAKSLPRAIYLNYKKNYCSRLDYHGKLLIPVAMMGTEVLNRAFVH
ncbi:MAG: hypothetical protein ACR2KX_01775 [Chitinophagaceae bacterium]